MKRKVNKVGSNTLTVSLPNRWVKYLDLKPGDELNLYEDGIQLIISPEDININDTLEMDLSIDSDDKTYVRSLLGALYRKGYDVLHIRYEKEETFRILRDCVNYLIGFEIMETKPNFCVIEGMLTESEQEFQNTLHKIVNVVKTSSQLTFEDYNKSTFEHLDDMEDYRYTAWKLRDYAIRILNKKKIFSEVNSAYVTILWTLEKINRDYKRIYEELNNKEINYSEDIKNYLGTVNEFFLYFTKNISSDEIEKLNKIHHNYKKYLKEGAYLLEKKQEEVVVIHLLMNVVNRIQDMSSALFIKNLK
ncbi:MAG: AbrB/MazE/SpoVT family DNA-binding domain-containing protein [Candidatus Woesearchaeota archaeon]